MSQVRDFERCGLAYKLARIDKVWERPAAWLDHGSAVHKAVELYEQSGRTLTLEAAQQAALEEYRQGINRFLDETPNADYWFSSGPYRGFTDITRRADIAVTMVGRYYEWVEKHPDEVIWVDDEGKPGIELAFNFDLDGVAVRGYIDQLIADLGPYTSNQDAVLVRDVKTGAQPGDDFQLKVYALAVEDVYDVEAKAGDYWMGKSGKATKPYDLTKVSRQEVVDRFHAVDEGIKAGRFEPNPGEHCGRCPVATSCPVVV